MRFLYHQVTVTWSGQTVCYEKVVLGYCLAACGPMQLCPKKVDRQW